VLDAVRRHWSPFKIESCLDYEPVEVFAFWVGKEKISSISIHYASTSRCILLFVPSLWTAEMEAFLKGSASKKRKSDPVMGASNRDEDEDEDESTDVKLAILASLLPDFGQEVLLEALLAHDGSVERASTSLLDKTSADVPRQRPQNRVIGSQSSLRSFVTGPKGDSSESGPKKARLLSKKGTTLHLYDPKDVAEHTPCTIIHNFLPPETANDLLREMMEESKSFEKITFKLFENVVQSPHTSSFYVETDDELSKQRNDYYYNGDRLTVSRHSPVAGLSSSQTDRTSGRPQDHPQTSRGEAPCPRRRQQGDRHTHRRALS
jgi:hypothetical protein